MITRIRKKPVEVQAMRHDGTRSQAQAIVAWVEGGGTPCNVDHGNGGQSWPVDFQTTDGNHCTITAGVWVIRGVAGEFYPCRDDILRATYDILPAAFDNGDVPLGGTA